MGMYSMWKGDIKFKNEIQLDKFLREIDCLGWYNMAKDFWIWDGLDEEYEDDLNREYFLNEEELTLSLPNNSIRNFHRVVNLLVSYKWEGMLVGVSDDGCFEGWVYTPEGETTYDLEDWAKQKGMLLERDHNIDDYDTEQRVDVMDSFLDDPIIVPNSKRFIMED